MSGLPRAVLPYTCSGEVTTRTLFTFRSAAVEVMTCVALTGQLLALGGKQMQPAQSVCALGWGERRAPSLPEGLTVPYRGAFPGTAEVTY